MSIQDYVQKAGEWVKINQADIAIVLGFILVALIAFGAGRLTAPEIVRNPIIIDGPTASSSINLYGAVSQSINQTTGEGAAQSGSAQGMFVASKNSNKYHWPWCSWAEKIKEENKVWFQSEAAAQAAGFSPCSCIVSKAPAGYQKP